MKYILLGTALVLAAPAAGKDKDPVFVETRAVKDKPVAAIDPAKAYILLRIDRLLPMYLMKEPSSEDAVVYSRIRAVALAEARAKYLKKRAHYDRAVTTASKARKGEAPPNIPEKPIEPKDENFEFTPFELLAGISIGPMNRFAKGSDGMSTYLQEVTPATYRLYGPVNVGPGAAPMGTCFCMGSVRFEARAGEITDLGIFSAKDVFENLSSGDASAPLAWAMSSSLKPAPTTIPSDRRLSAIPTQLARYRPTGKLPNYFGVAVSRIPAIPGVLRYDHDRIVDLTRTE